MTTIQSPLQERLKKKQATPPANPDIGKHGKHGKPTHGFLLTFEFGGHEDPEVAPNRGLLHVHLVLRAHFWWESHRNGTDVDSESDYLRLSK